jgi:putative glutamine amidotransferase
MSWTFLRRSIRRAGGEPVRLTPSSGHTEGMSGMVLGGGADLAAAPRKLSRDAIRPLARTAGLALLDPVRLVRPLLRAPALLAARALAGVRDPARTDPERDAFEAGLLERAMDRELPVLGICRGAQLINTHLDGTLHEDVRRYYERPGLPTLLPARRVSVVTGTRLEDLLGTTTCHVNALHRQAIRSLGRGLVIAAVGDNGIVQAIEHTSHPFLVGVQWHPEYLPGMKRQRALFSGLVDACARSARSHG